MRRPLIVQLHGGGYETLYDRAGTPARVAIDRLLERAACVTVPCESVRSWVRRIARDAEVACVPAGVAVPEVLESQALDARSSVVLFLGRLERDKGAFDLLDAIASVRAAVPDVRLVCAGDGDRDAVHRYAARLGIRDSVKFTGWVGPSGKRALFESAAVLAAPSYEAALPMSMLEAMAAGVPVAAAAVGGIPEVVVDGVSGFLVAPGDSASLARVLKNLLADRELGARVGAAGRETVRLRYAPERVLPRLEEMYAALGVNSERLVGKAA
jgi:glycosyltransferase involved in cell wall biosynthesis